MEKCILKPQYDNLIEDDRLRGLEYYIVKYLDGDRVLLSFAYGTKVVNTYMIDIIQRD